MKKAPASKKAKAIPESDVRKLADYFGVTVAQLRGEEPLDINHVSPRMARSNARARLTPGPRLTVAASMKRAVAATKAEEDFLKALRAATSKSRGIVLYCAGEMLKTFAEQDAITATPAPASIRLVYSRD